MVSASPIVMKNVIITHYFKPVPEGHTTFIHYSIFIIHYVKPCFQSLSTVF